MNKTNLQKEFKEKVKQKENNINLTEDEGYISDNSLSLNKSEKKEIQKLEKEVKFWTNTANNHLKNLQKTTAELDSANLDIKALKKIKLTKAQSELEKALQEANQKIRDQEQTIQELETEKEEIISQAEETRNEQAEIIIKLEEQLKDNIDTLLLEQLQEQNREYKQKISKLERENNSLNRTISELKSKPENKGNSQGEQKLFTCSQCQQEWNKEFIRLIDKQGNKICVDCLEQMTHQAGQETGKEIIIETQPEPQIELHKPCQFCSKQYPQSHLKPRHIANLPNQDPKEITLICQDCLTYRAIKADYYCPRTSQGRDTYDVNEFDCYCPNCPTNKRRDYY